MALYDHCEDQVITALDRIGWHVTHRQLLIRYAFQRRKLFADLRLRHTHVTTSPAIIIVEVKCFAKPRLLLNDFYSAAGQYALYRNALLLNGILDPIYLTVPENVYDNFFQEPAIQATLKDVRINLIIVNLFLPKVVTWITQA